MSKYKEHLLRLKDYKILQLAGYDDWIDKYSYKLSVDEIDLLEREYYYSLTSEKQILSKSTNNLTYTNNPIGA